MWNHHFLWMAQPQHAENTNAQCWESRISQCYHLLCTYHVLGTLARLLANFFFSYSQQTCKTKSDLLILQIRKARLRGLPQTSALEGPEFRSSASKSHSVVLGSDLNWFSVHYFWLFHSVLKQNVLLSRADFLAVFLKLTPLAFLQGTRIS